MRITALFTASLVAGFLGIVQAATVQLPAFKHILTGTVITSPSESQSYITSPYGKRLTAAGYLGGNFTTPSGTLVANVYPNIGGDSGITDNNGVLHVDTRMTWKFVDDNAYGFLHAIGFGIPYVNDTLYFEFETDSKKHQDLNDKYWIGYGTFSGAIWSIYIFALAN
ncbi:hypothetical protein FRB90_001134 [Tulasnella sp. 427]|nr:hypothetical protein FRB90_001134 [Tulasnella sp. 427]